MKIHHVNSSIVILAEAHNTTILHPEFLKNQGVVPKEWSASEAPLCTPALSVVRYKNISLIADINKFQVVNSDEIVEPRIADLAARYIEVLPHVHYTALGINFTSAIETEAPMKWIAKRFFPVDRDGDSDIVGEPAGARFTYPKRRATFNWEVGEMQRPGAARVACVLVNTNYNFELRREAAVADATSALATYSECMRHFELVTIKIASSP